MNKTALAISAAALLLIQGCSSEKPKEEQTSVKEKKQESSVQEAHNNIYGASMSEPQQSAPSQDDVQLNAKHVAKVLETMEGGGYSYAKVDEGGNIYWIAGPQSNISTGSTISFLEQMVMTDFTSKSLNRHFDQIVFVSAIVPTDKPAAQSAQGQSDGSSACKTCDTSMNVELNAAAQEAPLKIAKNSDGYTVEELYAKKAQLKDKPIKVNAKVVKVSRNIMGKDWIHLQDGSGSAGTNDIIATAVGSNVQVGDSVTASGVVKTDIDLGYGYNFPVLIEEAKFSSL